MNLTTLLDLAGLLLLVAAVAGLAFTLFGAPAGLAAAGLSLLGASWLIDALHRKARK